MDQRLLAAGTGAVIGLVLVVTLALVRLPAVSTTSSGGIQPATLQTLPPPIPPDVLIGHFENPGWANAHGAPVSLSSVDAGHLNLPSGRLAIGDAFFLGIDNHAVGRTLPAGSHPVTMLQALDSTTRAPVAALVTAAGGVERWQRVAEASYAGAETGVVGLLPAELDERLAGDAVAAEALAERLYAGLEAREFADVPWLEIDAGNGHVLYAVPSESGVQAAWWGLGGDGEPVALLLDFGVLEPDPGG